MTSSGAANLRAALTYLGRGWAVLPVWWIDDSGNCACGLPNDAPKHTPGKHPLGRSGAAPHGVNDATTDEALVRKWVARYPRLNLAVACGKVSGRLVTLDVDPRNGGDDTLARLEAQHGPLPLTPRNLTGGGGSHLLFEATEADLECLGGSLGPGIEVKSNGGYIVVPPSRHLSGGIYEWDAGAHPADISLARLPSWVVAVSRSRKEAMAIEAPIAGPLANHPWQTSVIGTLLRKGVPAEVAREIVAKAVVELRPNHGNGSPYTEEEARALAEDLYRRYAQETREGAPAEARQLKVVRLSDVAPEIPQWIWPGKIVLGALNLIDGDPDIGKTTVALDIAARVTRGAGMPDGPEGDLDGPQAVIYLTAEDSLASTIRPRLDAAGADCSLVLSVPGVTVGDDPDRPLELPTDIGLLEDLIRDTDAKLVVTDVLVAFLADQVKTLSDHSVRRVLSQLSKMAERTGAAVVALRHLNKSGGGNPLYRGGGSIGIIGQARSGLILAKDPEDESGLQRILAVSKGNLAPPEWKGSVAYELESTDGAAPRIQWSGKSDLTAESLLTVYVSADERDERAEVEDLLRDILADGQVPANEVLAAGRKAGHADKAIRAAAKRLGVDKQREGFGPGGVSYWSLPPPILGILSQSQEEGKYAKYGESMALAGSTNGRTPHGFEWEESEPPPTWDCRCGSSSVGECCWNCKAARP